MPARDAAILELFYSSGLRLAELAALNCEDLDPYTETVRVFGKGRKERVCPVGVARAGGGVALPPGGRGAGGSALYQQAARAAVGALDLADHEALPAARRHPGRRLAPTSCGTRSPPICSTPGRTCAACRNCSATPISRPPRFTPRSRSNGSRRPTTTRIPAREGRLFVFCPAELFCAAVGPARTTFRPILQMPSPAICSRGTRFAI